MKYCEKCGLQVRGYRLRCPLCDAKLSGTPEQGGFPQLPNRRRRQKLWLNIVAIASVAACVVCLLLNFLFRGQGPWSLFVLGGVLCLWLGLAIFLHKHRNIPKCVLYESLLAYALCVVWDLCTGWHGWSVDFAMPILCIGGTVALTVLARVFALPNDSLIVYITTTVLLGMVQLILLMTQVVQILLPSVVCVGASVLALAAMFIFGGKAVREEFRRRLHL